MSILQVLIFSVVEAITEFLPVSSTAHLILMSRLLGIAQSDFLGNLEIFIQLGAILAVLILFWRRIWGQKEKKWQILAAFVPTTILGFLAHDYIKEVLFKGQSVTGWALIIGGIGFIIWSLVQRTVLSRAGFDSRSEFSGSLKGTPDNAPLVTNKKTLSTARRLTQPLSSATNSLQKNNPTILFQYLKYALIGLLQCVAFIPGVSRSAATFFGGLLVGLNKKEAVEFSFLLAIPTMVAASGLDLLKILLNWSKTPTHPWDCTGNPLAGPCAPRGEIWMIFSAQEWLILGVGMVATFIISLVVVRKLMALMEKEKNWLYLGIYRLVIGVFWLFMI